MRPLKNSYVKLGTDQICSSPSNPDPAHHPSSENHPKPSSAPIPEASPIKKHPLTSASPANFVIRAAPAPSLSENLLLSEANLIVAVKSLDMVGVVELGSCRSGPDWQD